jgi:Icc-related predicted phosphoesterase
LTAERDVILSNKTLETRHDTPVRLAALGDIHCTERSQKVMNHLFKDLDKTAEILLVCGDITDTGRPTEMKVFLNSLQPSLAQGLTVVAILGEHDHHSQQAAEVVAMGREAGIVILEGEDNFYVYKNKIGIAGIKGYWGGFAPNFLPGVGEPTTKHLVTETLEEVRRLYKALHSLPLIYKVVMMHYAPIRDTLKGESPEMYTTLGCEWLSMPLDEEGVQMCFHGHAHYGSYSGITKKGTPVYNVALPLLRRQKMPIPNLHLI